MYNLGGLPQGSTRWILLGAIGVLTVSILAMGVGPGDELSVDRPSTQFDWTKADGDLVFIHSGGETLERETLHLAGDGLNAPITNLGDGTDEHIVKPFNDSVVSEGDTLVIDGDAVEEGEIALRWDKPGNDQEATLISLEDFYNSTSSTVSNLWSPFADQFEEGPGNLYG